MRPSSHVDDPVKASWAGCVMAFVGALWLTGCASPSQGPESLRIAPEQYAAAFDAAVDVAREHGLTGGLRDRRAGVIETDARIAGSVLEPWRTDNASTNQSGENTLNFQRRRARFEFAPVGFRERSFSEQPQSGPELLNDEPLQDLTQSNSELEIRVWVYIERAHTTGVRRSTWARNKTTVSRVIDPDTGEVAPANTWVPVRRDLDYERRLMGEVADHLGRAVTDDPLN
jgi:hypothetical protein